MLSEPIILKESTHEIQVVGFLKKDIIDLLNINLPSGRVLMYPGAINHIKKRPEDFAKYFHKIPEIIANPDYAGVHPNEPNSVELVKAFCDAVLVAIKLAPQGYLYLSSMYCLTPIKVPKRLKSGRLVKVPKNIC